MVARQHGGDTSAGAQTSSPHVPCGGNDSIHCLRLDVLESHEGETEEADLIAILSAAALGGGMNMKRRIVVPGVMALLFALPAAVSADETGDMIAARRHYQAGLAAFIKQDVKGASAEITAAMSLERTTRTKDGKSLEQQQWNSLKRQIQFMGSCVRGLSHANLEDEWAVVIEDFDKLYRKKGICREFNETSLLVLGMNAQQSKDEMIRLCNLCLENASYFIGLARNEQGEYEASIRYLTEYIEGKGSDSLEAAYDNRASAYMGVKNYRAALKDADELVKLNPGERAYWASRGHIKLRLFEGSGSSDRRLLESAGEDLAKALRISPGYELALTLKKQCQDLANAAAGKKATATGAPGTAAPKTAAPSPAAGRVP